MGPRSDSFDRLHAASVYPHGEELLPPEATPIFNLDPSMAVGKALARLPYVYPDSIESLKTSHIHYLQHQQVRVERIVAGSYNVYGSWVGNQQKRTPEGTITSLEHAQALARDRVYALDNFDPIWLKPFIDDDGDIWFRADQGSHRIMAAKINCEQFLIANIIDPDKGAPFDHYSGMVIKTALEKNMPVTELATTAVTARSWAGRIGVWSLLRPTDTAGRPNRRQIQGSR